MSTQVNKRKIVDSLSQNVFRSVTIFVALLFFGIILVLLIKSWPVLSSHSIVELLFKSNWNPDIRQYGFYPAIVSTFFVTFTAMLISIPVSLLTAIFISEYTNENWKQILSSIIDILAGIPSVVFGIVGLIVIVPFTADYLGPWINIQTTGMCVFSAAVVLSIMVFPIMISLMVESFSSIPIELQEISFSLGANKLETIARVLLKAASPGIISAILLGFGRAFGETLAVAMVIGSKTTIPDSIFDAGQTLPSLIVNSFGEMMSIPEHQSALLFVALILLVIVSIFNILARYVKKKVKKRWKYDN